GVGTYLNPATSLRRFRYASATSSLVVFCFSTPNKPCSSRYAASLQDSSPQKASHPRNLFWRYAVRILPEYVHVHVHYHEVQEYFHGFHLAGLRNDTPVWVQFIWVENAERTSVIFVSNLGKDLLEQHSVTVPFVYRHILAIFRDFPEVVDAFSIQ